MEHLKQMSLKQAYFYIGMIFFLMALMISIVTVVGIGNVLKEYEPSVEIKIGNSTIKQTTLNENHTFLHWYHILELLQVILPLFFITIGLLFSNMILYHLKLKKPLAILQNGAERIMKNDLDFALTSDSQDELGQLCCAFEKMRLELLKHKREQWSQMEERKRLNAAFSHDLRNPLTVLKGSAKMLRMEVINGTQLTQNALDSILLIEEYSKRMETYVEAMNRVQRLEELPCCLENSQQDSLLKELLIIIHLLTMDTRFKIEEQVETTLQNIWIDKTILFNVAENLVANAIRYAKTEIQCRIVIDAQMLCLSIEDDGTGYPPSILQKGAEPFLRGVEEKDNGSHFGMGLYVCRLLCEKHQGSLTLQNTSQGAMATAKFKIVKA